VILPEPVTLKRFLAPLWVFCLGMSFLCWLYGRSGFGGAAVRC
jgi:hypothetical protein